MLESSTALVMLRLIHLLDGNQILYIKEDVKLWALGGEMVTLYNSLGGQEADSAALDTLDFPRPTTPSNQELSIYLNT